MAEYVLTVPLNVVGINKNIINERFDICKRFQNELIHFVKKQLDQAENTKVFKEIKNIENITERKKAYGIFFREYSVKCSVIVNKQNIEKDINPFDRYGVYYYAQQKLIHKECYKCLNCKQSDKITDRVKKAIDKHIESVIKSNCSTKSIKIAELHVTDECNSFSFPRSGENIGGAKYSFKDYSFDFKYDGKNFLPGGSLNFYINEKHDYECFALKDEVRVITIKREFIRGKYKYFIQFTLKGNPYTKGKKLGEGKVGIDLGTSTIAVTSENNGCLLSELAGDVTKIDDAVAILQRKIKNERIKSDPQNFIETENGKLDYKDKIKKLVWHDSKKCKYYQKKLKSLYTKRKNQLTLSHNIMANQMLSYGNDFKVEDMNFKSLQARSSKTEINEKTGKFKKKKRYGKSIKNHAPAAFTEILKRKVVLLGGNFEELNCNNAATQYDFTDDSFKKHELCDRNVILSNGDIHQRDLLSAYNLMYCDGQKKKTYDRNKMSENYDKFKNDEKICLDKIKNGTNKVNDYIKKEIFGIS